MMHGAMPLNLSLEWPSVWGGKSLKFLRKIKDSRGPGVLGGDPRRGLAESEPKVALSMGRKIIENLQENEGFQGSLGVTHGAQPLNLSLEWPSVWGGKSMKLRRKITDSMGPWG